MNDKITFSRRRFTWLISIVTLFLISEVRATILKYLLPRTVNDSSIEIEIAKVDEVLVGSIKTFIFNGKAAILLKMPAGFRAFGAVCTHLGCIAYWKPDENIIFCPCHLGKFDPNTGDVISGPPPSRLPSIDIAVKEGKYMFLGGKLDVLNSHAEINYR